MRRIAVAVLAFGLAVAGAVVPAGALSSNSFVDGAPRGTMTPYGHSGSSCFDLFYSSGASGQLVGLYFRSTADCGDIAFYFASGDDRYLTVLARAGSDIVVQRSDLVALGFGQFDATHGGGGALVEGDPCAAWPSPVQLVISGDTITTSGC